MATVAATQALLDVNELRVAYRDRATPAVVPIVDGVSFSLRRGEADHCFAECDDG